MGRLSSEPRGDRHTGGAAKPADDDGQHGRYDDDRAAWETAVGAVGLCAQFSSLMFSGYWGFVGGGMLFFSQYWGAKDENGIDRSYGLTLVCMLASASIFACLALFAPELVMQIYTDKASIQAIGVDYLRKSWASPTCCRSSRWR